MPNPDWRFSAPSLDELISGVITPGSATSGAARAAATGTGGRCAIVIPVHDEAGFLGRHLDALERQTSKDFDVILVHSPGFSTAGLLGGRPYGITALPLKHSLGAGAFYAGQKYALEAGYRTVILADVDAIPVSPALVGRLSGLAASSSGSVFLPGLKTPGRPVCRSASVHWYGAMSSSALLRAGLTYLPIRFGGEDSEFGYRLSASGLRFTYVTDVCMDHPINKPISLEEGFVRTLFELRNSGLLFYRAEVWPKSAAFYGLCSSCFFDSPGRFIRRVGACAGAVLDLAAADLSKNYAGAVPPLPPYPEARLDDALSTGRAVVVSQAPAEEAGARFALAMKRNSSLKLSIAGPITPHKYFLYLLGLALTNDIVVVWTAWRHRFSPPLLLAKSVYVVAGDKAYEVQRGAGIPARCARFAASMLALCLLGALYLPASFAGWLRLRGAFRRYGVRN
jgi:hypothetical protein